MNVVRARIDRTRTWDIAITNAPVYTMYIYRQRRRGADPSLSFLGPTASHFRAEGPRLGERNPAALGANFPSALTFIPALLLKPAEDAPATLSIHLKLHFKLYSTQILAA